MSSKITFNSITKEKFKITVKRCETGTETENWHSFWNCGYIYIPIQHERYINSNELYVHGGITYEEVSEDGKFYVLGFDCAHYMDMKKFRKCPRSTDYCKNDLIHLSRQIKKQIISGKKKIIKNKIKKLKGN